MKFEKKMLPLILASFAGHGVAGALEDNSFLVEEAYNQEKGVVQFIQSFQRSTRTKDWDYLFVNEIPIDGQKNQFSYEIPVAFFETNDKTNIEDVKLNYRREFFRSEALVATGRLSAVTATGNHKKGFGSGSNGIELAIISSIKMNPKWSQHWNFGFALTPNTKNATDASADTSRYFWALSNIYFLTENLNFMLELTGSTGQEVISENKTTWNNENLISPSVRYALDYKNWQFVPGLAFPIGIGPSAGDNQVLAYLSIEGSLF